MAKIDQFLPKMKPVKPMNYPRPYIICFVKKIKRRLKKAVFNLILMRKQIGYPLPMFTGFTGFTRYFWLFLSENDGKVVEIARFLLKTRLFPVSSYEYCEYLCICSGSKGVFCYGLFSALASQKRAAKSSVLLRMNLCELMRNLKFTRDNADVAKSAESAKWGELCIR